MPLPSAQLAKARLPLVRLAPSRLGGGSFDDDSSILARAVFWTKAKGSNGALVDGSGRGHAIQHGSAAGADSNDPLWLPYGGTQYLYLPGNASNDCSLSDSAALSITGDIDLRAAVALDDWTPSTINGLINKLNEISGGQRSYTFYVETNGKLTLGWTADGSAFLSATSTIAPTVADGALLLVRAVLDVDNGAAGKSVFFYTKTSTPGSAYADLRDNTGWTQLGTTVTTATTTSIFDGTTIVRLGSESTNSTPTSPMAGKFYAAAILNGIAGTEALLVNFADATEPFATFTESSSNAATVTINRSATGRKSTVVDRDLYLLGTDDYFEIADSDDLDFAALDSLTVCIALRRYGASQNALLSKRVLLGGVGAGWILYSYTDSKAYFNIADGAVLTEAASGVISAGVLSLASGQRNVGSDQVLAYVEQVAGTPVTDATTGSLANAEVFRIGRNSGGGTNYADMAFMGAAIFRESLSAADLARVKAELMA